MPARKERLDTLDQAWAGFAARCGLEIVPIPNCLDDPADYLERLGARAVILSGGGNISSALGTLKGGPALVPENLDGIAPERDRTESALLRASLEKDWPVIGVCRGMQVINLFHGGRIEPVKGHVRTRHALSLSLTSKFFSDISLDSEVNSFHDLGIPPDGLGDGLEVFGTAGGWPELFIHKTSRHLGMMWHPERNESWSAGDIALFSRFLRAS